MRSQMCTSCACVAIAAQHATPSRPQTIHINRGRHKSLPPTNAALHPALASQLEGATQPRRGAAQPHSTCLPWGKNSSVVSRASCPGVAARARSSCSARKPCVQTERCARSSAPPRGLKALRAAAALRAPVHLQQVRIAVGEHRVGLGAVGGLPAGAVAPRALVRALLALRVVPAPRRAGRQLERRRRMSRARGLSAGLASVPRPVCSPLHGSLLCASPRATGDRSEQGAESVLGKGAKMHV